MSKWKKGRNNDYMFEFPSVQYWQNQLRSNGLKNVEAQYVGTKNVYMHHLLKFNEWLQGRIFDIRIPIINNHQIIHENTQKSFKNIEELLHFGEENINGNNKEIKKNYQYVFG